MGECSIDALLQLVQWIWKQPIHYKTSRTFFFCFSFVLVLMHRLEMARKKKHLQPASAQHAFQIGTVCTSLSSSQSSRGFFSSVFGFVVTKSLSTILYVVQMKIHCGFLFLISHSVSWVCVCHLIFFLFSISSDYK